MAPMIQALIAPSGWVQPVGYRKTEAAPFKSSIFQALKLDLKFDLKLIWSEL